MQLHNERRDQVLAWLGDNGHKARHRLLVRDTAAQFAKYPGQIDAFQIQLGSQWLDGSPAVLLAGNLGGFSTYPLTAEQARTLRIESGTRLIRSSRNVTDRRRATPRATCPRSASTAANGRISARKSLARSATRCAGPAIAEVFAVRLMVMLDGGKRRSVLQWFKKRTLEGRGTLRFLCPPLASGDFQPRGPVVVFADLCTDDDGSLIVESDATAVLIESVPPANSSQL